MTDKSEQLVKSTENLEKKMDTDGLAYQDAYNKYLANRKTKSARKIVENFSPQRVQFENARNDAIDMLANFELEEV